MTSPVAVITGASQGLGLALAHELAGRGWSLVLDARHEAALTDAVGSLPGGPHPAVAGDVADPAHRRDLVDVAAELGGREPWSTTPARSGPARSDVRRARHRAYLHILQVTWSPPCADRGAAAPAAAARRGGPEPVVGRGARGLETWGGYSSSSRARPRDAGPGGRGARAPGVRRRPGRHAHPDDQDAFPARTSPTGRAHGRRSGAAPAPGGLPARGRYRASELLAHDPSWRPHDPPPPREVRAAARQRGDGAARGPWSRPRPGPDGRGHRGADPSPAGARAPDVAGARRPARREHQRDAAVRAGGGAARLHVGAARLG